jgi:cysteine synthase A
MVEVVRPASFSSPDHYVKKAQKRARHIPGAVFIDQFENEANFSVHFEETGSPKTELSHRILCK